MSATDEETGFSQVTVRAPAKINLVLAVGPLRDDGFHPLETVYAAISLYDDVTVSEAAEWSVRVSGDQAEAVLAAVPETDDNLAVRAGRMLAAHHDLHDRAAEIAIHKQIPVAAGLAGGSADAAATLVALDRLWALETPDDELLELAAELGSDVPFALLGGTALGTGRGEQVEPIAVADTAWVVVTSHQGLPTPAVYREYDESPLPLETWSPGLAGDSALSLPDDLRNDLEEPALRLRPDLAATRDALVEAGAIATILSGSGPTYLGLARDPEHAREIAGALKAQQAQGIGDVRTAIGPVAGAHVVTFFDGGSNGNGGTN